MTRLVLVATLLATQAPSVSALFRSGSTQYVGIRYWLQNEGGTPLTESQAPPASRYSVHFRSNVAGFLVAFSGADGPELTSRTCPPYAGLELQPGGEFRLPGAYRLARDGSSEYLVFLFARSQIEVVRTFDQAVGDHSLDQMMCA